MDDHPGVYLPTPDDIRAGCEAIRATWRAGEEARRREWSECPAEVPTIAERDLPLAASDEAW